MNYKSALFAFLVLYTNLAKAMPLWCTHASCDTKEMFVVAVCDKDDARDKLCLYHPLKNNTPKHVVWTDPILSAVSVGSPNQTIFKKQKTYQIFQTKHDKRPTQIYAVSKTGILYAFDERLNVKWRKSIFVKTEMLEKVLLKVADIYIEDQWHTILTIVLIGEQRKLLVLDVTNPIENEKAAEHALFLTQALETLQNINALFVGHLTREQGAVIIGALKDGHAFLEAYHPKTGRTLRTWDLEKVKGEFTTLLPIDRYSQGVLDRIYAIDNQNNLWSLEADQLSARKVLNGDFLENTLIKQHALIAYWDIEGQGVALYWRVVSEVSRLSGIYEVFDKEEQGTLSFNNTIQRILPGIYRDHFVSGNYLFTLSTEGSLAIALQNPEIKPLYYNFAAPLPPSAIVIKRVFDAKSQRYLFVAWEPNNMFSIYFAPIVNNKYGRMSWRRSLL